MENAMVNSLKALVSQVNNASLHSTPSTVPQAQSTVRIADVRRAAEDAKDTLRHRYGA
jgi:hypothetical protein